MKNFKRNWLAAAIALLLVAGASICTAIALDKAGLDVIEQAIDRIGDDLTQGKRKLAAELSKIGFGAEVAAVMSLDGKQLHNLSARVVLETLWRRANAAGDGDKFLARLIRHASKDSAALAGDEKFKRYRIFAESDLDVIKFAPLTQPDATPLPAEVDAVIEILARAFSAPHLSDLRIIAIRRLNLPEPRRDAYESALAESVTVKEVLLRLLAAHAEPPSVEIAAHNLAVEAETFSGALKSDPEFRRTIEDLKDKGSDVRKAPERTPGYKPEIRPRFRPR